MEGACRRLSPNRFFVIGLGLGLFIDVLSIKSMNRLQLLSLIVCFCKHSNRVELLFSRLISLTVNRFFVRVSLTRATVEPIYLIHMASNLSTGPSVSLKIRALDCRNSEADHTTAQRTDILYRPGDIIPAVIEVHKHRSFEALSFHGSLIGMPSSPMPNPTTD